MKTKLYRVLVIIALSMCALQACSPNGDWTSGSGCENGATCVYEYARKLNK